MASPGQINHVEQGIAALPEKYRQDPQVRYLLVYLQEMNDEEQTIQDLITQIFDWWRSSEVLDFILDDIIGPLLAQPRPDGFTNDEYKFVLLARTRVRRSANTRNDVLRVASFLARDFPFIVAPIVPRAYLIAFMNLGLSDQWKKLYEDMLLDTIGQVDALDLKFISTGTAIYDSLTTVYDSGLYA